MHASPSKTATLFHEQKNTEVVDYEVYEVFILFRLKKEIPYFLQSRNLFPNLKAYFCL